MSRQNQAVVRINVHEDQSKTFDVLICDGPGGGNEIEVNCEDERYARSLIIELSLNKFQIMPDVINDYNEGA